jgi:integrase
MSSTDNTNLEPDVALEEFIEVQKNNVNRETIYQDRLSFRRLMNICGDFEDIGEVDEDDIHDFVSSLRSRGISDPTIDKYLAHLRNLYKFHMNRRNIQINPVVIATQEMSLEDSPDERRHIEFGEMKSFVQKQNHPLHHCVVLLLLKTGIRNGELCNLDIRDLHIDNENYKREYNVEPRSEIESRSDTLYVDSDIGVGDVVNGEKRKAGNKRKVSTIIPIDQELKYALLRYLAIRPDTTSMDSNPLFVSERGGKSRYSRNALVSMVTSLTEEEGWYEDGEDLTKNVTPHYFRHYFSSHNRQDFGDAVLKYIRGDKGGDIVDHYTHSWALQVREKYLDNIYKFY